jgi:putative transposase
MAGGPHLPSGREEYIFLTNETGGCPISRVLCEKWGFPCSSVTDIGEIPTYASRVPRGLKRFYGNGDLHFITASCYRRQALLGTAYRKDLFVKVLEQVRQRYEFVVVGYVVMPEHFHLLISEPVRANPSVVIQALKLAVVRRLFPTSPKTQEKLGTVKLFDNSAPKHFWQRRFYDFNVWSAHKHREKLRYIHRNPVKRGLVETPDQWRWSSFRAYAFGETVPVMVNDWSTVKMKISAA